MKKLKSKLAEKFVDIQKKVNDFQKENPLVTILSISSILAVMTNIDILNTPINLLSYTDFIFHSLYKGLGYGFIGTVSLLTIFNKIDKKFNKTMYTSWGTAFASTILPLIATIAINPNISNINNNNFLSQNLVVAEMYSQGSEKVDSINKYLQNNLDYKTLISSLFNNKNEDLKNTSNNEQTVTLEILNQIINAKLIEGTNKSYDEILNQILKPLKDKKGINIKKSIKEELSLIKIYESITYKITNMNEEQLSQYTIDKLFKNIENLLKKDNIHNFQDEKIIKLIAKYEGKTQNGIEIKTLYKYIKQLHNNLRVQEIANQSQELGN